MLFYGWTIITKAYLEHKGRKIPKSLAIYNPLLSELLEAAVSLGL